MTHLGLKYLNKSTNLCSQGCYQIDKDDIGDKENNDTVK